MYREILLPDINDFELIVGNNIYVLYFSRVLIGYIILIMHKSKFKLHTQQTYLKLLKTKINASKISFI